MVIVDNDLDRILKQKFTSSFRKGYVNAKGYTMPQRYEDLMEEITNWEVNEKDIWMCSFPKTGTTWTQEMVWMMANNLDFEGGKVNLGHRSPFFEVSVVFDYRDLMEDNKNFKPPPFLADSLAFVKSQQSPVYMKSHLPFDLLPDEIRSGEKKPKIIYIARNPKDTCISYYHHCKLLEGYTGDFDEFCKLFLAGKLSFAPYWKHVMSFWKRRNEPNILFIKYEDMKKNLPPIIRQVAEFLECSLTDEQIDILDKHLSFESMKKNKAVNYEMVVELNKKFNLIDHDGVFMRSGTVGGYKTMMSPEIIEQFDEWTEENTKGTGLFF